MPIYHQGCSTKIHMFCYSTQNTHAWFLSRWVWKPRLFKSFWKLYPD